MTVKSILGWLKEVFMAETKEDCGSPAGETLARIKVRVNLEKNGPCWQYAIEADDHQSDLFVKAGNKIDFPNGQPTSIIEFRLQGKAGQKLDFDLADPIWVKVGDCPTQHCSVPTEIKLLPGATSDRLEIENKNLNKAELHYRLNFVDQAGNKLYWDPIIRNNGGGGP